jgi:hypothetical protein
MKNDVPWVPPAKRREIAAEKTPADYEDREQAEVDAVVQRILGCKLAPDAQEAEPEPGPALTKAQQRRAAEKKSERDRRFGR